MRIKLPNLIVEYDKPIKSAENCRNLRKESSFDCQISMNLQSLKSISRKKQKSNKKGEFTGEAASEISLLNVVSAFGFAIFLFYLLGH